MKTHQPRVVSTVAIPQQVPTLIRFAKLAIEAQFRGDFLLRGLLPIGGVGDGVSFTAMDFGDDRKAAVGCQ
jgi:hypothetical protein